MGLINIIPNLITESGKGLLLNRILKFSLANLSTAGSGINAWIYVNDALTWQLAPGESAIIGSEVGYEYHQTLRVEFKNDSGDTLPNGSLNIILFRGVDISQIDHSKN
jgi:hypothetical protein